MQLTEQAIADFRAIVWDYYDHHARPMPWRDTPSAYYVLVSELMLQQTQVQRVIPKFQAFIARFPDVASLAAAPLAAILDEWSGLGYNRRAKFLHAAAQRTMLSGGVLPTTYTELLTLPGIGPNTAAAIMNYAYNEPHPFVETNIRTVYFEHFFVNESDVADKEVLTLVAQTIDAEHPRQWFWALMDYGTHLKRVGRGRIDASRHYKKQPPLAGSVREVRGRIIKILRNGPLDETHLYSAVSGDERFGAALDGLEKDGLIICHLGNWCLTGDELSP